MVYDRNIIMCIAVNRFYDVNIGQGQQEQAINFMGWRFLLAYTKLFN